MAGIKDTFSKGLTTLNVKTSNFMEENKQRTFISTQEQEIEKIKIAIGNKIVENWGSEGFSIDAVSEEVILIQQKLALIDEAKAQIESLAEKEKEILGAVDNSARAVTGSIFCSACGAPNKVGFKFCEKCGNKLEA